MYVATKKKFLCIPHNNYALIWGIYLYLFTQSNLSHVSVVAYTFQWSVSAGPYDDTRDMILIAEWRKSVSKISIPARDMTAAYPQTLQCFESSSLWFCRSLILETSLFKHTSLVIPQMVIDFQGFSIVVVAMEHFKFP